MCISLTSVRIVILTISVREISNFGGNFCFISSCGEVIGGGLNICSGPVLFIYGVLVYLLIYI